MTKKKIISLMAIVMVIQLLVPFGIVAKQNKGYTEVDRYGTAYLMKVYDFDLYKKGDIYDVHDKGGIYFDFFINGFYDENNDKYFIVTGAEDSVFTMKTQVKKNNNYIDCNNIKTYYNISNDEYVFVATEAGKTPFTEEAQKKDFNSDDIRVQIKVYRGKAVITGIFYKGEQVITLDNYRMT